MHYNNDIINMVYLLELRRPNLKGYDDEVTIRYQRATQDIIHILSSTTVGTPTTYLKGRSKFVILISLGDKKITLKVWGGFIGGNTFK